MSIIHLIEADKDQAVREIMDRRPLRLKSDQNMLEAIEVASGFVGETIPVIEEPGGKMIGVVSESIYFPHIWTSKSKFRMSKSRTLVHRKRFA